MTDRLSGPKPSDSRQADLAPALDSDPVYERVGEGRWEIAPEPQPFAPFLPTASGDWADTRSAYDVDPSPGPGFLDPGTHALLNHVAPLLASEATPSGAVAGASADLAQPIAAEGRGATAPPIYGGGDGDGDSDDNDDEAGDGEKRRRWWQRNKKKP